MYLTLQLFETYYHVLVIMPSMAGFSTLAATTERVHQSTRFTLVYVLGKGGLSRLITDKQTQLRNIIGFQSVTDMFMNY